MEVGVGDGVDKGKEASVGEGTEVVREGEGEGVGGVEQARRRARSQKSARGKEDLLMAGKDHPG